jgi:hypothetical protein
MARSPRFIIDKITNCIEEKITGNNIETDIISITPDDIKSVRKKDGWFFNWKKEYKENPSHSIYKLVIRGDTVIQGIISLEPIPDQLYIEMHLIENAPHNYGAKKKFLGVAGNMVAFACKLSFDLGYDGFVAFDAKTRLVDHYTETLGAQLIFSNDRMGIFTPSARNLVNSYYKNYFIGR